MNSLFESLYATVKAILDGWQEEGIYAISFLVTANEANAYRGFRNLSSFSVSYNTESDCEGAGPYDEERWNYAFWRQEETPVIDLNEPTALVDQLLDWYSENGIPNPGHEEEAAAYDSEMRYIGKGPAGHYELLLLVSEVAQRLQREGYIQAHFGRRIPILVHGLEYAWYDMEATQNANPHGEADGFLQAMAYVYPLTFSDLVGKTLLVGLTYYTKEEEFVKQAQYWGQVTEANDTHILILQANGELFSLPPDLTSTRPAPAGEYRLHSTGEVVVDPDYLATWSVTLP